MDRPFAIGPLSAFVDTGADGTVIPASFFRGFPASPDEQKYISTPWGERHEVDVYWLDVGIGDIRLPFIEIVADEQIDEVIVGRNVLNKLRVLLDGIALEMDIRP